jgi:hypothetical protein
MLKALRVYSKQLGANLDKDKKEAAGKIAFAPDATYTPNRKEFKVNNDAKLDRNQGLNKGYTGIINPQVNFANLKKKDKKNKSLNRASSGLRINV